MIKNSEVCGERCTEKSHFLLCSLPVFLPIPYIMLESKEVHFFSVFFQCFLCRYKQTNVYFILEIFPNLHNIFLYF